MKKLISIVLSMILVFTLVACSSSAAGITGVSYTAEQASEVVSGEDTTADSQASLAASAVPVEVDYDDEDLQPAESDFAATNIQLNGDAIAVQGSGAEVNGSLLTITAAGVYNLSGALRDGQIVVEAGNEAMVTLVLNGVDITCSNSAPIYVNTAEKVILSLADGTQNFVRDGAAYVFAEAETDEPDAAIFSKDDLTINGSGALTVTANYNNGIASKDDLKITGGTLTVSAANDGIKGRDSLAIKDGTITITAGGDGLQANNDEDLEKGYVSIEGGVLNITAAGDGIQAETSLLVSGGDLTVVSGNGRLNSYNDSSDSAKGLKAGSDLSISGGTLQVTSSDDALHSNDTLSISGGEMQLASGDDGVHAETSLLIVDGMITISQSYEGLESAAITINGGTIRLASNDDGINAAGGVGGSLDGAGWGRGNFEASGNYSLTINGGYVFVDAIGDGLDVNGPISMTGGTVIVNGPTSNGNGPVDYTGTFNISGGFFVAVGSSGMAMSPSQTSTQYSVLQNFASPISGGTLFHLESADGEDILTFIPTKAYQSVLVSSPALQNGVSYVLYTGGSATGAPVDGLYMDGTYTPGTQLASFTISSIVTGGGMGGGFPGGGGGGGRPRP